jgi:GNAT superfamily N-acetyltransferase
MPPLAVIDSRGRSVVLRRAVGSDVPLLIALLVDDAIGATREGVRDDREAEAYLAAFRAIERDENALLVVADVDGELAATAQLTVVTSLSRRGARRGEIESVRVGSPWRGTGIGSTLIRWLIEEARRRGCSIVQLTSDKRRQDAIRFYQGLGFQATHEGLKLPLD